MPDLLQTTIATVRAYAAAVRPVRIVVLLDRGDGATAVMVEWTPEALTVSEDGAETVMGPVIAVPANLPELREIPGTAIDLDLDAGQISAPVGAIAHMSDGVRALAAAAGGRSVAAVDFQTADPEVTLTLAARLGEGVIAAAGEEQFQLPDE